MSGRSGKLPGAHRVFVVATYQWGRCPTRIGAEVAIGRCTAPLIMGRMATSDPAYKLLFSQPRMVEDTLRGYVAPDWCEALDFSTLTRMNAEYIGLELYNRIGDMLWRVEFREGSPLGGPPLDNAERPYLLVLFEFQSAVDPDMAWRMHEYVYLLQRHQRGNGTLKAEGREPPVLAVVVYNGDCPWTAGDARSGPVVEGPSGLEWTGQPDADLRGARRAGVGGGWRWLLGKGVPASWKSAASARPSTVGQLADDADWPGDGCGGGVAGTAVGGVRALCGRGGEGVARGVSCTGEGCGDATWRGGVAATGGDGAGIGSETRREADAGIDGSANHGVGGAGA